MVNEEYLPPHMRDSDTIDDTIHTDHSTGISYTDSRNDIITDYESQAIHTIKNQTCQEYYDSIPF